MLAGQDLDDWALTSCATVRGVTFKALPGGGTIGSLETDEEFRARLQALLYGTAKRVPYPATSAVQAKPAPVPEWKASRDSGLQPGECPCGIVRSLCEYHK